MMGITTHQLYLLAIGCFFVGLQIGIACVAVWLISKIPDEVENDEQLRP
jgi:hypothetical protein